MWNRILVTLVLCLNLKAAHGQDWKSEIEPSFSCSEKVISADSMDVELSFKMMYYSMQTTSRGVSVGHKGTGCNFYTPHDYYSFEVKSRIYCNTKNSTCDTVSVYDKYYINRYRIQGQNIVDTIDIKSNLEFMPKMILCGDAENAIKELQGIDMPTYIDKAIAGTLPASDKNLCYDGRTNKMANTQVSLFMSLYSTVDQDNYIIGNYVDSVKYIFTLQKHCLDSYNDCFFGKPEYLWPETSFVKSDFSKEKIYAIYVSDKHRSDTTHKGSNPVDTIVTEVYKHNTYKIRSSVDGYLDVYLSGTSKAVYAKHQLCDSLNRSCTYFESKENTLPKKTFEIKAGTWYLHVEGEALPNTTCANLDCNYYLSYFEFRPTTVSLHKIHKYNKIDNRLKRSHSIDVSGRKRRR